VRSRIEKEVAATPRPAIAARPRTGFRSGVDGGSHPDTDPVTPLDCWPRAPAALEIITGPLLRGVARHETLSRCGAMSNEAINERVRALGQRAGRYGGLDGRRMSMSSGATYLSNRSGMSIRFDASGRSVS
jgi:hypothetical protein